MTDTIESLRQQLAECQAELQSTRLQMITDFGQYQEAHEKVNELSAEVEKLKDCWSAEGAQADTLRQQNAELTAEVERLRLFDNLAKEYGLSVFADIAELTAQRDEAIGVLEHIRRCIPYGGFAQIHDGSATVADIDAAIANCKEQMDE